MRSTENSSRKRFFGCQCLKWIDRPYVFFLLPLLWVTLATRLLPFFYGGFQTSTYWLMGFAIVVGFLLSLEAHAAIHTYIAGQRAPWVTRSSIVAKVIKVYASGIISSLLVSLVLGAITAFCVNGNLPEYVTAVFFHLACANLTLAVFQMLPALPLDGGKMLLGILSANRKPLESSLAFLFFLSQSVVMGFLLASGYQFMLGGPTIGAWLLGLGLLLLRANFKEYDRLRHHRPDPEVLANGLQ